MSLSRNLGGELCSCLAQALDNESKHASEIARASPPPLSLLFAMRRAAVFLNGKNFVARTTHPGLPALFLGKMFQPYLAKQQDLQGVSFVYTGRELAVSFKILCWWKIRFFIRRFSQRSVSLRSYTQGSHIRDLINELSVESNTYHPFHSGALRKVRGRKWP